MSAVRALGAQSAIVAQSSSSHHLKWWVARIKQSSQIWRKKRIRCMKKWEIKEESGQAITNNNKCSFKTFSLQGFQEGWGLKGNRGAGKIKLRWNVFYFHVFLWRHSTPFFFPYYYRCVKEKKIFSIPIQLCSIFLKSSEESHQYRKLMKQRVGQDKCIIIIKCLRDLDCQGSDFNTFQESRKERDTEEKMSFPGVPEKQLKR